MDFLSLFCGIFWSPEPIDELSRRNLTNQSAILLNHGQTLLCKRNESIFECRIAIAMPVHKDCYEQYWRYKNNFLIITPGFPKVLTRDKFLAIWSMLHCVDEKTLMWTRLINIYKSRLVFNYIFERFQKHYEPNQELSLVEGIIPTKNSLYVKYKPIRWGLKTFLLTDSEHVYIVNAEIYSCRRDDSHEIDSFGVTGNLVVRMTKKG